MGTDQTLFYIGIALLVLAAFFGVVSYFVCRLGKARLDAKYLEEYGEEFPDRGASAAAVPASFAGGRDPS